MNKLKRGQEVLIKGVIVSITEYDKGIKYGVVPFCEKNENIHWRAFTAMPEEIISCTHCDHIEIICQDCLNKMAKDLS